MKPKIAFFDFACCEGCQLQVTNLGEELFEVLESVDIVEFREVMSEKWDRDYDISIIEGSIVDGHSQERIKKIREKSKILIAYGSCATIGGINGIKNFFKPEEIGRYVYGKEHRFFPTVKTQPVHQVVRVDYFVHGCPVYIPEFITVLKHALSGLLYAVPDLPVCVECKLNENVCLYDIGITCLGPITRAGCNSWCINNNNICYGCRGMVSNPAEKGQKDVLLKYNVPVDFIENKMKMYNKCRDDEK